MIKECFCDEINPLCLRYVCARSIGRGMLQAIEGIKKDGKEFSDDPLKDISEWMGNCVKIVVKESE